MTVKSKLQHLPNSPGVYLMKDENGKIIYVGKAVNLKNRVRSYFTKAGQQSPKVQSMVSKIADLEYMVTDTEVEALILECNLIKKHRPKYNVSLKDDKHYPYIKVTLNEDFPRVIVTRKVKKDKAKYFGPYTRAGSVHETLKVLGSLFPLRTCKQPQIPKRDRPCLNAHIERCLAPCSGEVSRDEYMEMIQEVLLFLEGRQEGLMKKLEQKMAATAEKMEYEKAAQVRDQINALRDIMEKQKVISANLDDQDVIAMARGFNEACVIVFFIRGGKLLGRDQHFLRGTEELNRSEVLTTFVKQYYNRVEFVPPHIYVEAELVESDLIQAWLTEKRGRRVHIKVPQRGEKIKLVEMAGQNALMAIKEREQSLERKQELTTGAVEELQKYLGLKQAPVRMECYDISNIQGHQQVGSMVVFENGEPDNGSYRRFKIKTVEGPNDFASMTEVLTRRFGRAREEQELVGSGQMEFAQAKFLPLPDLVIIDGGKGQLSAARAVMKELGFSHLETFGLAKREEELFSEGESEPVILPKNSPALYLVQRIRDEAHRFAITFHRQLRGKEGLLSTLEQIPGIGPQRRKNLLKAFGSISKIRNASLEELAQVPGMNMAVAEEVLEKLNKNKYK
ncbi:excinuclease ABC subunit UvrC [Desulfitispora alkaliphila]|uniref:excinuclease ABC subunit UvrC n=1 Tax=Desulfitispora alkaliphila TaxID=622674 RepID=UPI003D1B5653